MTHMQFPSSGFGISPSRSVGIVFAPSYWTSTCPDHTMCTSSGYFHGCIFQAHTTSTLHILSPRKIYLSHIRRSPRFPLRWQQNALAYKRYSSSAPLQFDTYHLHTSRKPSACIHHCIFLLRTCSMIGDCVSHTCLAHRVCMRRSQDQVGRSHLDTARMQSDWLCRCTPQQGKARMMTAVPSWQTCQCRTLHKLCHELPRCTVLTHMANTQSAR